MFEISFSDGESRNREENGFLGKEGWEGRIRGAYGIEN
jgi:hypothetical protein